MPFSQMQEKKMQLNSLQTTLHRLYSILSGLHGAILLVSTESQVEFANQSFCEYFRLKESPEELKGLTSEEILEKIKNGYLQPEQEITRIKEIVARGKTVTGEEVTMQDNRTCLRDFLPLCVNGNLSSRLWHYMDITEFKKSEEELSESEQRLRFHAENIPLAVVEWDHNFVVTRWAGDAEKILGWKTSETLGKPIMDLHIIYEPDTPIVEKTMGRLTSGETKVVSSNRNITKDGRIIYCTWYNSVLLDEKGKMTSVFSFVEDNTARVRAENALEENNRNLEKLVGERTKKLALASLYARNLIEASLDPLVTISVEGKITDVNKATEIATGRSREELIGSDFSDYFTEPEKAKVGYKRVFNEGFVRDYPLAIRHKSGKIMDVLYNAAVYRNEMGEIQGVFAAARDITEQKKAEEQAKEAAKKIKDSERLAAIGATAGMVGHDIRNPLQAITGDVYLLKQELKFMPEREEKADVIESLDGIERNVDYINKIVADLQDYSRSLVPHSEETDVKGIIEDLLVKNGLPKNVKATVKVEPGARKIVADSTFINRIMCNLVNNAVQAMPEGGKLSINVYREASNVVITVKDTGVGIPEHVKGKLFTPMFTTKSKGQGFGLAVIKRMSEALGGTVAFESQEGKGTTFMVRLPQKK
jgi:PAS domain S-box-containing protein